MKPKNKKGPKNHVIPAKAEIQKKIHNSLNAFQGKWWTLGIVGKFRKILDFGLPRGDNGVDKS